MQSLECHVPMDLSLENLRGTSKALPTRAEDDDEKQTAKKSTRKT